MSLADQVDWSMIDASRRRAWIICLSAPALLAPVWFVLHRELPDLPIGSLNQVIALLLVAICAFMDVRSRKIPNWATYSGFMWGVLINGIAAIAVSTGAAIDRSASDSFTGGVGFAQSLLGGIVCLLIMVVVYSIARGGAGDVKLAAALGALLGPRDGLLILALTYLLGAVALIAWTIWTRGPLSVLRAFGRQIGHLFLPLWVAPPDEEDRKLINKPVPMGAFFAAATLIVLAGIGDLAE
jgi:Flp pilus assembly protein protease CpaA